MKRFSKARKTSKGVATTTLYGYGRKIPKGKHSMLRTEGDQIEW